ncbi:ammonium transporter [Methanocella conradii HZ254]|uniref:Ammonium transporter n=1 Tax=Methanocella conradii (strain DSM 24694 / JCM 17849 / CGMCC 1.5162 / HZ254) TaxID=1041930 RepID=H8I6C6_METCZ|nr:ammonium transporter [Methanocella conradii]AFD01124.1 ammonium transporter [Methanocella conradii HZ254]MDI6897039.1 ammonium transporter [Methanocella conradii]
MTISSGDTAWLLASTALVMIMTPGVGFFYGGLVRRKNLVSMITLSLVAFALVSVQWVLFGYSIAFGPDINYIIGGLNYLGLNGIGQGEATIAGVTLTVPALAYTVFQLVFATVTLAILTSVFAERVKLSSFIIFGLLWTTLVYDPLAHWVWGGGWLANVGTLLGQSGGALDFAGGTVVHISSGFSALAIALVIRKRIGFGKDLMEPSNIPLALLGATLLWFGWFGFNAGSAIAANGLAASAFVVTNTAAAAAGLTWMLLSWKDGRPASLGFASGALAGLVAITPASGFVDPLAAIIIGAVASMVCYYSMLFRIKKGLDESCDCWSIHGMGGVWGALATGIFATTAVNGYSGLLYGNPSQFIYQAIAVCASIAYAFVVTFVLVKILDSTIGMTVKEEEEYVGLDISQHGERAYS